MNINNINESQTKKTDVLAPGLELQMFQSRRGHNMLIRQLNSKDTELVADLVSRISLRTRWLRFMLPVAMVSREAAWQEALRVTQADPILHPSLIVTIEGQDQEQAIAVGELVFDRKGGAEIALLVRDDYQGEGLGSNLAMLLTSFAMQNGISTLQIETLAENTAIHRLVRKLGFPYTSRTRYGQTEMKLNLQAGWNF